MERTCVLLKPDAVQRRLIGEIVGRFERKGLTIVALELMRLDRERCERFYQAHREQHFYEPLVKFMSGGAIVALCLEGKDAIDVVRRMLGSTFGPDAPAGTIRGDFGMSKRFNLVHGSDSPASAERELAIIFAGRDLVGSDPSDLGWIYDLTGPEPV